MEKEVQDGQRPVAHTMKTNRELLFQLAAVVVLAGVTLSATAFFANRMGKEEGQHSAASKLHEKTPLKKLFLDWPKDKKPDLVLICCGERYGYIQPCGCSKPQYGGLDRLYNFLQYLNKEREWPTLTVDLGDVAQKSGIQRMKKYKLTMEAMKRMAILAVGIGKNEMSMPLIEALANYSLENPTPAVVAANLKDKKEKFLDLVKCIEVSKPAGKEPSVGVIGMVGPSIATGVRDSSGDLKFEGVGDQLPAMIKEVDNKKADLRVLLYQGTLKEAKACAQAFQQFSVIVCRSDEDEPPQKPEIVGQTMVVTVGHKGRYVGAVGFYRTGKADKPYEMTYQLVPLGPDLEMPDKANPIIDLFEKYTKELKDENMLSKNPRHKHPIQLDPDYKGAHYVGSEACKSCHGREYRIWAKTPHSHAFKTLEDSKRPSLRQFDAECIVCHVVGFDHETGYMATNEEKRNKLLVNVGCENCHGPGSVHIDLAKAQKKDPKLVLLMNPFREPENETPAEKTKRMNLMDMSCQKCHDQDNDVHWSIEKWKKIEH